ncbi:MAG: hypothetical protein KDJ75_07850 [Alphaproteobacteria bacterium]|nr:hypothetical protein [Alphaproteobacteria bacterium]
MTINLLTEGLDEATIPEKFKDPESGALRLGTLLSSYEALERKMSARQLTPASHEDYCIECAHGMFTPDTEVNRRLHEKGLTQEQVQEVYDLAAERLVPMVAELVAEFQADRELERLERHFGGSEKWQAVSRQLLAFGHKNLEPTVLDNLAGSFEGVLALYRMMKSEEPGLERRAEPVNADGEKDLHSMMRDPRYWRDRDPAFISKVTEGFQTLYGRS